MAMRKKDAEVKRPGRKPKEPSSEPESRIIKKRQPSQDRGDKGGTGLRHFSLMVCQKVEEKGVTTYGEVADILIGELQKDEEDKNIRRRVYDALNVLMAMNIITKDRKEIRWVGLPKNSVVELVRLENEKREVAERLNKKKVHLQELLLQEIAFKNLISRNGKQESEAKAADPKSCIHLPFLLVNTHAETKISCEMLEDRSQYYFEFDTPFEIHDDIEVLRRMGMNKCTPAQVRELVPEELHKYLPPNMQKDEGEALVSYDPQTLPSSSPAGSPYSASAQDLFDDMDPAYTSDPRTPSSPHSD